MFSNERSLRYLAQKSILQFKMKSCDNFKGQISKHKYVKQVHKLENNNIKNRGKRSFLAESIDRIE